MPFHGLILSLNKMVPPIVWRDHSLFSHSHSDRHLDCFQVLASMNRVDKNICVQIFVWTEVFSSFGEMPRSMIAGPCGKSMFNF